MSLYIHNLNMDDFFKNMDVADVFKDSLAYNTSSNMSKTNETHQPHKSHRKHHSHQHHHHDQISREPDVFSTIPSISLPPNQSIYADNRSHFGNTYSTSIQSSANYLFPLSYSTAGASSSSTDNWNHNFGSYSAAEVSTNHILPTQNLFDDNLFNQYSSSGHQNDSASITPGAYTNPNVLTVTSPAHKNYSMNDILAPPSLPVSPSGSDYSTGLSDSDFLMSTTTSSPNLSPVELTPEYCYTKQIHHRRSSCASNKRTESERFSTKERTSRSPSFSSSSSSSFKPSTSPRSQKKVFVCNICNKQMTRNETLKNHISSVHNKLKPFKCDEPGCEAKLYATQNDLRRHKRENHSKETKRYYPCYGVDETTGRVWGCGKTFSRGYQLSNHWKGVRSQKNCGIPLNFDYVPKVAIRKLNE
ncbi:unnamed protein product [Ambrosiozyma monospora]|uniref:Unnamed protein product n=1 Tax=Ambrosiozyma monospora TaxID=43982 RepID=A0A9W6Z1Z4_AMBMO|nr:unnamed protein product [Ambrosiozyma monospora]